MLLLVWFFSLLLSAALHRWGQVKPDPIEAPFALILLLVVTPALGFAGWLLGAQDHGKRESADCDQESR